MKRNKSTIALFLAMLLSSCQGGKVEHPLEDYRSELSFQEETFKIMQLTDIHWSYVTILEQSKAYLDAILKNALSEEGHIDLVVITGDIVLNANPYILKSLIDYLDGWNLPLAFTYGNHEKEGTWSTAYLNSLITSAKNSITRIVDGDNVYGETNYLIDIKDGSNLLWQIYCLDSNSLAHDNGLTYQYDNIHQDQVDWLKRMAKDSEVGGTNVPSLGFIHIPPKEMFAAQEEALKDPSKHIMGESHEKCCATKLDSEFFDAAKNINMQGIFFGHDHSNDNVVSYQDVLLGYGVKSTPELYYYEDQEGFDWIGYSLIELKKDHRWSLKHVYLDYDDPNNSKHSPTWESSL